MPQKLRTKKFSGSYFRNNFVSEGTFTIKGIKRPPKASLIKKEAPHELSRGVRAHSFQGELKGTN